MGIMVEENANLLNGKPSEKRKLKNDSPAIDNFLRLGRYTMAFCVFAELAIFVQTGNLVYMLFGGSVPEIIGCKGRNVSFDNSGDYCLLIEKGECDPIQRIQFESVVTEFNYLCANKQDVKWSMSLQQIGYMMGTVFGQIGDRFGRKWPHFFCLLFTSVSSFAAAFAPNLWVFTVFRCIATFFNAGQIGVMVVYMCETFPKNHRMWLSFVFSFSPNIILFSLLAWATGNWRTLSVILNLLAIPPLIINIFLYESPFWLLHKGRFEDARRVIDGIGRFDNSNGNEKELEILIENEKKKQKTDSKKKKHYNVSHLFRTRTLSLYTIAIGFSAFTVALVNFGVLFNMETMSGSLYVNSLVIGGLRFSLNIFFAFVGYKCQFMGRKLNHAVCALYTVAALGGITILHQIDSQFSLDTVIRFLFVSANAMITQIFPINAVTASEVFPSSIRNIAYSSSLLCGAFGSIFSPLLFSLKSLWDQLPYVVMLGIGVVEVVVYLLVMPESKGIHLPDKMPEKGKKIGVV